MPEHFLVRVYDNFHHMDEQESYDRGEYGTFEEALAAAKEIVERSVAEHGFDHAMYTMFGEDPAIVCPPGNPHPRFSAWDYAAELCEADAARKGGKESN